MKLWFWIDIFGTSGAIGCAIAIIFTSIYNLINNGGDQIIYFNRYNEQLLECILFPILILMALISMFKRIKRQAERDK